MEELVLLAAVHEAHEVRIDRCLFVRILHYVILERGAPGHNDQYRSCPITRSARDYYFEDWGDEVHVIVVVPDELLDYSDIIGPLVYDRLDNTTQPYLLLQGLVEYYKLSLVVILTDFLPADQLVLLVFNGINFLESVENFVDCPLLCLF